MDSTLKTVLIVSGLAGLTAGAVVAYGRINRERLLSESARLIIEEGARLEIPVNRKHVRLALLRLNNRQLKVLYRWIQAVVNRDEVRIVEMIESARRELQPVFESAPEWKRYLPIVVGT